MEQHESMGGTKMTELMKRYEAETGNEVQSDAFAQHEIWEYIRWLESQLAEQTLEKFQEIIRNQCDEISALKAQLTWRPVSEKPEISDKYYVIRKGFAITFRDICLFMDGEWCVNRVSEEHGGEYWQPIEKDNTCPVVLWFPAPIIPPAPEKV